MARRSNSSLPAYREEEPLGDLVPLPEGSALKQAGQAADWVATSHIFSDYQERVSANTRRRHEAGLASFAAFLHEAGIPNVSDEALARGAEAWAGVTWGLVKGYMRWLLAAGYAVRTVNARLSTLKVYCRLAHEAGVLDQESYSRIRLAQGYGRKQGKHADEERRRQASPTRIGAKKAEPTPIPDDVAVGLKRQADTPQGRRDALLMCLLLDHGLRCSEVAELQIEHFDVRRGTFTFYRRKVDLTQTHRMTRDTRQAAQAYFANDNLGGSGPLLRVSNKHGSLGRAGMTVRAITKRVCALGEALGVGQLSAHDCRHHWATVAVRNGTHVKDLQDAGGWASPTVPLQYAQRSDIANKGVKLDGDSTS